MYFSISKKISLTSLGVLLVTMSIMLVILLTREKNREMARAEQEVQDFTSLIVNAIKFSMIGGNSDVEPLIKRVSNVGNTRELRLVPSDLVRKGSESRMDAVERQSIQTKQTLKEVVKFSGEPVIRTVVPILAEASCVECHGGSIGDALAVVSLRSSISEAYASTKSQRASAILLALATILITTLITFVLVDRKIVKAIKDFVGYAGKLAAGNLGSEITVKSNDEIGQLANSFREMSQSLQAKAEAADSIARGNLETDVKVTSQEDVLGAAMKTMVQNLKASRDEVNQALSDAQAKVEYLNGLETPVVAVDKNMTIVFINNSGAKAAGSSVETCIGKKCYELFSNAHCQTAECAVARAIQTGGICSAETVITARGLNLPIRYTGVPVRDNTGQIIGGVEQVVDLSAVKNVVNEVNRTAKELVAGNLKERAKAENADGDYRKLVEGFNRAIDGIMEPVNEALDCLDEMAKGNLTVSVEGDYKGDHAKMKDAMNSTLAALNGILGNVSIAVEQVASGSQQVADSSQSLSQGATEQASSLEEITSSMQEMASQTRQNAENATQANQLATDVRKHADTGNSQMQQMLGAMNEINESSDNISKIIKVIDEIAFQTNLLALNAAVEAARAGVHGKGFAVVAEEVRNLAQRSAKAAKETTELIEGSVKKAENGTEIANETAKALEEIVTGVTKVTDLIGEIASASNEQAQGIDQVNQGLGQIDQVTQANTASAEESASAAEELSSQAAQLKQMLNKFQLQSQNDAKIRMASIPTERETGRVAPDSWGRKKGKSRVKASTRKPALGELTPEDVIALDDDDFGKF